jgi:5-formyltetrahydrofolate cyclo-ligase
MKLIAFDHMRHERKLGDNNHMNELQAEKKAIRTSVLNARDAMSSDQRARESIKMCESIIASTPYQRAKSVLAYASFGSEIDTSLLLQHVLAEKKILVMPRVNKDTQQLQLHRVNHLHELVAGAWGIREPHADAKIVMPAEIEEIDFILVPGVAFDSAGFRIGYGKGFYDKLLSSVNPASTRLSAAFDCQIVDAVPNEIHDERVDIIITPTQKILISHDRKNH